uniref:MDS1 and EVI1 complex locus protein EVI1-B n=1 Tax=Zeugodacus cucurbitae TaxID=28588 RepID=A0A0A1WKV9_ZEUCU
MLSFFSKKRQDTDSSAEEAIQGPTDSTQANEGGDDFIFIERKTSDHDPTKSAAQGVGMYPPIPPSFGMGRFPGQPIYPPMSNVVHASDNVSPVPYVQGVPFELAPQLSTKCEFEVTQLQVDSILALLTRQMSVDENEEYNFALERSIQNEC